MEGRLSGQEAVAPQKLEVCQEDKRWWWHDKRQCTNQPLNKRQTGGEAPADKRRWHAKRWRLQIERTRDGSSGTTRGNATTSQQTRGKEESRHQRRRGGSTSKAGGILRQQEAEIAWWEEREGGSCSLAQKSL
jgi:hypothetical protein